jgi:ABC-type transport system involved in cytochrome c biogenesis permease subunit
VTRRERPIWTWRRLLVRKRPFFGRIRFVPASKVEIANRMREKVAYSVAMLGAVVMVRILYLIFMVAPDEASQGMIYRLLYFHVPAWWTAFLAVDLSGVFSSLYLLKGDLRYDAIAASVTEVAVVFLVMGSRWVRSGGASSGASGGPGIRGSRPR